MENEQTRQVLEQQLKWCKEQHLILKKIETTLYEMKNSAEYAAANKLDPFERNKLKDEKNLLKEEVASLERQLHPSQIIH